MQIAAIDIVLMIVIALLLAACVWLFLSSRPNDMTRRLVVSLDGKKKRNASDDGDMLARYAIDATSDLRWGDAAFEIKRHGGGKVTMRWHPLPSNPKNAQKLSASDDGYAAQVAHRASEQIRGASAYASARGAAILVVNAELKKTNG